MGGLLGAFYLTALILQTVGLQRTSPGVSGFITGMSVAMVPFLYWAVARRSPGKWQIIGADRRHHRSRGALAAGRLLRPLGRRHHPPRRRCFYALHIMTTGFFAPKVQPSTLAVTQMVVSTAALAVLTPALRPHHLRPAVAGVGRRRVDGPERHHLRVQPWRRLKARLRPMRGLRRHRSARTLAAGHAFVQNLRRGRYELATDVPARHRIRAAFDQLAVVI